MKRLLMVLTLAGCATTTMMEDPCACVVIPTMNGALSMAVGSRPVTFDGAAEGEVSETLPISGLLFSPRNPNYTATGMRVESLDGIGFEAAWSEPVDLTQPAALQSFTFYDDSLGTVSWDDGQAFDLGPRGGQITLREIAPRPDGGWRVRASYAAHVCPDGGGDCKSVSGSFAFDAEDLPLGAAASGLVVAAS